jgi:hypothetical protein
MPVSPYPFRCCSVSRLPLRLELVVSLYPTPHSEHQSVVQMSDKSFRDRCACARGIHSFVHPRSAPSSALAPSRTSMGRSSVGTISHSVRSCGTRQRARSMLEQSTGEPNGTSHSDAGAGRWNSDRHCNDRACARLWWREWPRRMVRPADAAGATRRAQRQSDRRNHRPGNNRPGWIVGQGSLRVRAGPKSTCKREQPGSRERIASGPDDERAKNQARQRQSLVFAFTARRKVGKGV